MIVVFNGEIDPKLSVGCSMSSFTTYTQFLEGCSPMGYRFRFPTLMDSAYNKASSALDVARKIVQEYLLDKEDGNSC